MHVEHTLEPIYFNDSKVLILGTMPSIKSRKVGFYYGHPQNRFWKTLGLVYNEDIGESKEAKIDFLKRNKIALFDVVKSCTINGSSDASIKDVVPNDIETILNNSKIEAIFTDGQKAFILYNKYLLPKLGIEAIPLPSTSPANCKKGIQEELVNKYKQVKNITN